MLRKRSGGCREPGNMPLRSDPATIMLHDPSDEITDRLYETTGVHHIPEECMLCRPGCERRLIVC